MMMMMMMMRRMRMMMIVMTTTMVILLAMIRGRTRRSVGPLVLSKRTTSPSEIALRGFRRRR
eukprot:4264450-Karenia_brevis.AAC.1